MMSKLALLIYVLVLASGIETARILGVFPTPSISHQVVFRPLMKELAKRGHEVTVVTTDPEHSIGTAPRNLTEIDVHDISYKLWNKFMELPKGSESDIYTQIKVVMDILAHVVESLIKLDEVQQLLKEKKVFDLIFVEAFVQPTLIFSHLFNAPVIQFSSFGGFYDTLEDYGAPIHPVLYPISIQQRIHNLTIWQRVKEYKFAYDVKKLLEDIRRSDDSMFKSLIGPNTPDLSELKNNVQMLFLNIHPMWDFNRPVPPNVIYLGGLHQKPYKKLPQDIQKYLDSSKNGVIYMSFGTNVRPSLLPPEKIKIFSRVFSKLPYNVLLKWDRDDLEERSNNVKIFKWVPQSDLLRHPNVKVFITQGGLQSTDESISAAVPLIGIPMLGDQWYNTEQYLNHKIGLKLSMETLTEEVLENAIENVIKDESYRKNIMKLRDIILDQPQTPLERAVWWTEYVLRKGNAEHLRASGFGVSMKDYFEADLILMSLLSFVAALSFLLYLIASVKSNFTITKTKLQ